VAAHRPFSDYDPANNDILYVSFIKAPLGAAARRALESLRSPIDDFHHHAREVYWLRRRRLGESQLTGAQLERAIRGPATARNITTVLKLAARYPPA
jgi:uncharacterized protein (DUF1697 family)